MTQLKELSTLLGLPVSGAKEAVIDALLEMLDQPYDTKKQVKVSSFSYDVNIQSKRRRSSGKVSKTLIKKKSTDSVKPKKTAVTTREATSPAESEEENASSEGAPPKKKRKAREKKKSEVRVRSISPDESSDDDKPLRPGPSDADVKAAIKDFLKGKDLSTVTKGMVKEVLRMKYSEAIVKTKKSVIAEGIEEGMQS